MDNRAYVERSSLYDAENEGKSRTMLKKAALVSEAIERQLSANPHAILEVGCGTGLFTKLLAERFPTARITATDAFMPMLTIARGRLSELTNVDLVQYDAETAAVFTQKFDIVCGVDLIHHLTDPVAGLRHWRSVTAPGGALVFFESNPWNPVLFLRTRNRPEEARFKYNTPPNLRTWLTAAGWEDISVAHAPIYLPNGSRRLWRALGHVEDAVHPALWPIAGGMIVSGKTV